MLWLNIWEKCKHLSPKYLPCEHQKFTYLFNLFICRFCNSGRLWLFWPPIIPDYGSCGWGCLWKWPLGYMDTHILQILTALGIRDGSGNPIRDASGSQILMADYMLDMTLNPSPFVILFKLGDKGQPGVNFRVNWTDAKGSMASGKKIILALTKLTKFTK